MPESKIQFSVDDIVSTLIDWNRQSLESKYGRDWIGSVVKHDLLSNVQGLFDLKKVLRSAKTNYEKFQLEPAQAEILGDITDLVAAYSSECRSIFKIVNTEVQDYHDISIKYMDSLEKLSDKFPLRDRMQSIAPLNSNLDTYCSWADISMDSMIYSNNRIFFSGFEPESFQFKKDLVRFKTRFRETFQLRDVYFLGDDIQPLVTKVDYVRNAIEPLLWNVLIHAFPSSTSQGEGESKKSNQWVFINGYPLLRGEFKEGPPGVMDEFPSQGLYQVNVRDNGKGIYPDIKDKIFDRYLTTRRLVTLDHGIGLYGVKKFVEKHGGRIEVASEIGNGTTFTFSIPYNTSSLREDSAHLVYRTKKT